MTNRVNRFVGYAADSKWEESLKSGIMSHLTFHPCCLQYSVPESLHKYYPDWIYCKGDMTFFIEAKGYFREPAEAKKYLHIRDSLNINERLVFLFKNPKTPLPFSAKRKDGTKRNHGEWADYNGFTYFTEKTIVDFIGSSK